MNFRKGSHLVDGKKRNLSWPVVAQVLNLSTWEAEAVDLCVQDQLVLQSKFHDRVVKQRNPVSEKPKGEKKRNLQKKFGQKQQ